MVQSEALSELLTLHDCSALPASCGRIMPRIFPLWSRTFALGNLLVCPIGVSGIEHLVPAGKTWGPVSPGGLLVQVLRQSPW